MSSAQCQAERDSDISGIMVVDDDHLTLEIVGWIFRQSDTECYLYNDPHEAIQHLKSSVPAVLIVDYYMPAMNGVEFLHLLHESVDLSNCQLFLCSAVEPQQIQMDEITALGAKILEKTHLCDRLAMQELVQEHKK